MYILCDLFRKYADVDMIIILGNAPLKGEGGGGGRYSLWRPIWGVSTWYPLGRVPHSTIANVKMWLDKAVIDGMQGSKGKLWLMGYQMQFSVI